MLAPCCRTSVWHSVNSWRFWRFCCRSSAWLVVNCDLALWRCSAQLFANYGFSNACLLDTTWFLVIRWSCFVRNCTLLCFFSIFVCHPFSERNQVNMHSQVWPFFIKIQGGTLAFFSESSFYFIFVVLWRNRSWVIRCVKKSVHHMFAGLTFFMKIQGGNSRNFLPRAVLVIFFVVLRRNRGWVICCVKKSRFSESPLDPFWVILQKTFSLFSYWTSLGSSANF